MTPAEMGRALGKDWRWDRGEWYLRGSAVAVGRVSAGWRVRFGLGGWSAIPTSPKAAVAVAHVLVIAEDVAAGRIEPSAVDPALQEVPS